MLPWVQLVAGVSQDSERCGLMRAAGIDPHFIETQHVYVVHDTPSARLIRNVPAQYAPLAERRHLTLVRLLLDAKANQVPPCPHR